MENEINYDECNYKEESYDDDSNKVVYCDADVDTECIYRKKIRDRYGNSNTFICTFK